MPRPKVEPSVCIEPLVKGFFPLTNKVYERKQLSITAAEFEALRLRDYLFLSQNEAAELMEISKPSYNRLLLRARQKLATAIVEGLEITFTGGRFKRCTACDEQHQGWKCKCPGCDLEWDLQEKKDPREFNCPKCDRDCRQGRLHREPEKDDNY
ncbi:MAG: DUF134 domain-containing protein [Candidatus Odinarchaeota archaeon]